MYRVNRKSIIFINTRFRILYRLMELQILLILLVALLVFGPEKMLQLAVELGRFIRKIQAEFKQFQLELEMENIKQKRIKEQQETTKKIEELIKSPSDETKNDGKTQKDFLPKDF